MKREGNLLPKICTRENVEKAIKTVLRGTKRKATKTAKKIFSNKEEIIDKVLSSISDGTFRVSGYEDKTIKEGWKERDIQILSYYDRIVANVIMTVIDEILTKRLVYTSASSIKGRGTIYLKEIVQRDIRHNPKATKYFYKIDISKYYHNIDHDLMKICIRHYIKDRRLYPILDNFIDMLPQGLSIGLRSSQIFGNLLLNWLVDQPLKNKYHVKLFYRYCDDIVIFGATKEELWRIHDIIKTLLEGTKLSIKEDYRVAPLSTGLDFLGFVIYSGIYCRVRKRIKRKAQWRLSYLKSRKRRREVIASIKGYCVHSNGHHLFNTLITWQ